MLRVKKKPDFIIKFILTIIFLLIPVESDSDKQYLRQEMDDSISEEWPNASVNTLNNHVKCELFLLLKMKLKLKIK